MKFKKILLPFVFLSSLFLFFGYLQTSTEEKIKLTASI